MIAIFTAAFVFAFQAADDSAPASASSVASEGTSALVDMLHHIGPIALLVLVVLAVASLYSWTIIFSKYSLFGRATSESRKFVNAFRKASRLQEVSTLAETYKASPLAQVFIDVYETYRRQTGGTGKPRSMTSLERSAQTAASESITQLERRMTWLATIAATSPFVGLFGTVMGVVDAFHGLGTAGAATLRAVAPGISEALITTAAGLFVAVPAVVAYNQYTARLRVMASATDDFCRELLNSLEEIPERAPRAEEAERSLYK
ncbi:MAG TPA: MotA/TolQ/ExbB proton channel family protein [Terracidiphilus sp.]|nr:MotA/TolQ/ExbB proton channel family protein [Terracidiphilus sp.]